MAPLLKTSRIATIAFLLLGLVAPIEAASRPSSPLTMLQTSSVGATAAPKSNVPFSPLLPPNTTCCGNLGLQFAYYHPTPVYDVTSPYDPASIKNQTPATTGASSFTGINGDCSSSAPTLSIYAPGEPCTNFALSFRGYLYSDIAGSYNISITNPDDLLYMWKGDVAYSGWNVTNTLLNATYPGPGNSTTVEASPGEYLPLRIVFAQGPGVYRFGVEITAPDNTTILGAQSPLNAGVVRYSCDGLALPYQPYGQET